MNYYDPYRNPSIPDDEEFYDDGLLHRWPGDTVRRPPDYYDDDGYVNPLYASL
jgi:hypothetical protein